jgi:hypothetical protein
MAQLEDAGCSHDSEDHGASDRGKQKRNPEREMAGRSEKADGYASRILKDEYEQQHKHDETAYQRHIGRADSRSRDPTIGGHGLH